MMPPVIRVRLSSRKNGERVGQIYVGTSARTRQMPLSAFNLETQAALAALAPNEEVLCEPESNPSPENVRPRADMPLSRRVATAELTLHSTVNIDDSPFDYADECDPADRSHSLSARHTGTRAGWPIGKWIKNLAPVCILILVGTAVSAAVPDSVERSIASVIVGLWGGWWLISASFDGLGLLENRTAARVAIVVPIVMLLGILSMVAWLGYRGLTWMGSSIERNHRESLARSDLDTNVTVHGLEYAKMADYPAVKEPPRLTGQVLIVETGDIPPELLKTAATKTGAQVSVLHWRADLDNRQARLLVHANTVVLLVWKRALVGRYFYSANQASQRDDGVPGWRSACEVLIVDTKRKIVRGTGKAFEGDPPPSSLRHQIGVRPATVEGELPLDKIAAYIEGLPR